MSDAARISQDDVVAWLTLAAERIHDQKAYLTELDSAIGDADHGINMDRGFQAVLGVLPTLPQGDIGGLLKGIAMKLISTVGGASGPLYGTFFLRFGTATAGKPDLDIADFAAALDAGITGVKDRGKAEPNDKTMLDALLPASDALHAAIDRGDAPADALAAAVAAAQAGMEATIPLVARKGRASYLGERSAGHQDPGATSSHLLLKAAADTFFKG
jgi:phosphoenolpyruvate---glycerone phosphotransferase subunit DhaL